MMTFRSALFLLLYLAIPCQLAAQDDTSGFTVYDDGVEISVPDSVEAKILADSVGAKEALIRWLTTEGFLNAQIGTVTDTEARIERGCQFTLKTLLVNYTGVKDSSQTLSPGIPYSESNLLIEISNLIHQTEQEGFLFSTSRIQAIEPEPEDCSVSVQIEINTGKRIRADNLYFAGAHVESQNYYRKISRFNPEEIITPDYLEFLRSNLKASGIFNSVGEAQLFVRQGQPVVVFQVEERAFNTFDGLLGYVPDASGNGQIVGDAELSLWNIFTYGNGFNFRYQRLRPETSQLDIQASQHWIGNIPIGVEAGFRFYQNDTTYQARDFDFSGEYWLNYGFRLKGGINLENTTSGTDAVNVVEPDGRKQTARLGFEYTNLDRYDVPTSGIALDLMFGVANKDLEYDSAAAFTQNVLEFTVRGYVPLFSKSVIATSLQGFFLDADKLTNNDLIRFGGANSLRGFAEQQFRAGTMIWGDLEYRYLLNRQSYIFGFGAMGRYERPRLLTENNNDFQNTNYLFSTGFGLSYQTRIGRLKFTYAISPEESLGNGKVHIGIRTEL